MKYHASIDLSNKNNSHTLAFDRIQEASKGNKLKILEVGCSSGYFGAALTEYGHEVWGVEPYALAADAARSVLKNVYVGSVEDFFKDISSVKFDVIVFGDVLEHLVDPLQILQQCKLFLNDGGIIVASVPNIAHITIRAMLLEGRWDYAERGILDQTHLRFFTRNSLIDLFSNANYIVKSVDAVQLPAEIVDRLCELNLNSASIATAKRFATDHRINDFQYVLVAEPGKVGELCDLQNASLKTESRLKVLCLLHDTSSSIVDVRLRTPLGYWAQKTGSVVRIVNILEHSLEDLRWGDICIFQRNSSDLVVNLARRLQKAGKKIIFEIDDLLLDLPPFLAHHADSIEPARPFMVELLKTADALSVSTDQLADQLGTYSDKVFVTPNYSEPTAEVAQHYDVSSSEVKLVIASSDKVLVDMLVEPLKAIQKEYACQIIGVGPPGHFLSAAGLSVRQFEIMSHSDFKLFLASLDNSVGVIPLDDSLFSSCKSAVKYFDYSMAGLPTICSNVLPYRSVVKDRENGFLVDNTFDAWTQAIACLVKNSQVRQSISREARLYVEKEHNLDISAHSWLLLFNVLAADISSATSISAMKDGLRLADLAYVIRQFKLHAVRPSSYKKALQIIRDFGFRGIYRKLRY